METLGWFVESQFCTNLLLLLIVIKLMGKNILKDSYEASKQQRNEK